MNMVKPVIVLTVICIVASALLGFTYNATKDTIAAVEKAASDAAMVEVLPGASSFTTLKEQEGDLLLVAREDGGKGYVFKVQDKGYGGQYVVMLGIGPDGKITGTKLLDNSETPGLGSKTGMPAFTEQFTGKDASLQGVETITGATISSKTFLRCVDKAFEAYESVKEGA